MLTPLSYPSEEAEQCLVRIAGRRLGADPALEGKVRTILNQVRDRGDAAVLDYTREFDAPGMTLAALTVSAAEVEEAYRQVDQPFLAILQQAIENITGFHRHQLRSSWFEPKEDGTLLGQMIRPVSSAGLYIPGGKGGATPLLSSVLMNAIPAKIAGVRDLALTTPPRRDGTINPFLLVAASEVGVSRIHKLGSAWAIGALTYGTASVKAVDVVVGPGNIYVTLAKKLVSGEVGIDLLAGPSEILIIADAGARPRYLAADLLSQAEHDVMASSILVTDSYELAESIRTELESQLGDLARSEIARKSLQDYGAIFVTKDQETAVSLANRIAPEHLELQIRDPWGVLPKIRHAGAVFMGENTPEAVGDYFAGPNHVLPTAGTARFASALGVDNFVKKTSVVAYSRTALERDAEAIARLARLEGLEAHAASAQIRIARLAAREPG